MILSRSTAIVLGLLCIAAQPVHAGPDPLAINTAIIDEVIVPAYGRLADATDAHAKEWQKACGGNVQLEELKPSYHAVADAWAESFHWNSGPITFLLRRDRFYHWPERRNAVSKSLRKLLSTEAPEKLKLENFSHVSVAAQGLPAMERMLFEYTDTLSKPWNCKVAETIAANMAEMAGANFKEWRTELAPMLARGEEHPIHYAGPKDTLNKLFTELLTGYAIIKDQKILPVMGSNAKKAKPTLIEARRSNRFAKNLEINLQTLFAADAIMAKFIPPDEAKNLADQRKAILEQVNALPDFGKAVYDEQGRAEYKALTDALSVLRKNMVDAYTKHLGIVVGFNSLDGD